MAFNADAITADAAVIEMRQQARNTKIYMGNQKARFQAIRGDVFLEFVVVMATVQHIDAVMARMDVLIATPNMLEAARGVLRNQTYDILVEYAAWRVAMVNLRSALLALFPASPLTNPQAQSVSSAIDAVNVAIS